MQQCGDYTSHWGDKLFVQKPSWGQVQVSSQDEKCGQEASRVMHKFAARMRDVVRRQVNVLHG